MYRTALSLLVLLTVSLIAGCHSGAAATDTSVPITDKMFPAIRDSYTRTDSTVQVGLVTAVAPASNTAMVGDLNASAFSPGDLFTFLDSNHNILTSGKFESAQGGNLKVVYDPPAEGTRAPKVGDIAMHILIPK